MEPVVCSDTWFPNRPATSKSEPELSDQTRKNAYIGLFQVELTMVSLDSWNRVIVDYVWQV